MESGCSKFTSRHCIVLLLLNTVHCFSFVRTQTLCHGDERSALLQFKASFTIYKNASLLDPFAYPKVASWRREGNDQHASNCCSWDGVECDEDTGHVIALDLRSSCLYGSINSNSSLFQLVHLRKLDLSDNHFNFSEIPSRLGRLTSLTNLNLSYSYFAHQIPSEISKLSKLSALDLSDNYKFPYSDNSLELKKADLENLLRNLTDIKQLHLSGVDIISSVPRVLVNASSLISLRLGHCRLYGEFPVGIFHLPKLQVLELGSNPDLAGYLPDLNTSSPFKELNVQYTNFSGQIPASIGNLHSLTVLDIAYCNFYPHLPSLGNLTQLVYLGLSFFFDHSYTYFEASNGQVTESWSWVRKLTKLSNLGLGYAYLRGEFPLFVANLTRLEKLDLSYNQITGRIPSWLTKLKRLYLLDLGFNTLQGSIPKSLFQLRNLEDLDLRSNNLSGLLDLYEFSKLKKLKQLLLSFNKLSVRISKPRSSGTTFPSLEILALGSCNLKEFPELLMNNSDLVELDLSQNNIHGQIPKWMWSSNRESLRILNLSQNFLTGFEQNPLYLPWTNLLLLELNSNWLQGVLPSPPPSIRFYSVSNNGYTGEISSWFCNLDDLSILDLSNNNLSMLPPCLGISNGFEVLKLHNNSLHGEIPPICPNRNSLLKMVDLSYNHLQGKLPRSMSNCRRLEFLNLGINEISDMFPTWLGALPVLRTLILRSNKFHGMIGNPATNHEFPKLCIIDICDNGFSGMLPSNYLKNWNCMKSIDEDEQEYLHDTLLVAKDIIYNFDYSMTVYGKGLELKYLKTPNLLRFIDLSSNRFEGEIPASIIGNLRGLHVLDLSNNTLTGHIPSSLGNLTALESLDLSSNQLSGMIPGNLAELNFLSYFNVSNNHLWGPIPQGQQFGTFQNDWYLGNWGLCGNPLSRKCVDSDSTTPPSSSIFQGVEHSGFQMEFDWYVVLPGVLSGLIVGVVAGNTLANKKLEWFLETFSTKRQTRGTRRGHNT